jgi:hypothetical protein
MFHVIHFDVIVLLFAWATKIGWLQSLLMCLVVRGFMAAADVMNGLLGVV